MRKLSPNLNREDGLDTVLEVPIPEETCLSPGSAKATSKFQNMKAWMKSQIDRNTPSSLGRGAELQLMLGVIGAPLVPHPVEYHKSIIGNNLKDDPIEASMAKYIVQQYIAAAGGEEALSKVNSMYAMGKVQMKSSESRHTKGNKVGGGGNGEMGAFVLWQKRPDLWCIELVVSGCKITAGSDGKVAWRQTPWQQAHSSRGPPRPLRRCVQGLDPRSTADLFTDAVWIGEKTISGDDCFVLKLDTKPNYLHARSSNQVEVIRHTIWGYFSQRTGLLVQIEDSHLLKIVGNSEKESVYWETSMESSLSDYRTIDGVNIAHSGQTQASLFRFGESNEGQGLSKSHMEETWEIEEIDFNIVGLSMDCFLPPADLKELKEDQKTEPKDQKEEKESRDMYAKNAKPNNGGVKAQSGAIGWFGPVKIVAIDSEDSDSSEEGSDESP